MVLKFPCHHELRVWASFLLHPADAEDRLIATWNEWKLSRDWHLFGSGLELLLGMMGEDFEDNEEYDHLSEDLAT